jgi:hypothetical protein
MSASARPPRRLVVMTKNGQNPAYTGARFGADRVAARYGCALTPQCPKSPMTRTSSMRC